MRTPPPYSTATFALTISLYLLVVPIPTCSWTKLASQFPVKPLSPAQEWAVATSAILWERNKDRHDVLGIQVQTPENDQRANKILSDWWGVTNKETLLRTMRSLQKGGHRRQFEQLGVEVESLSEDQFQQRLTAAKGNEQGYRDLQLVREHYKKLGPKSLLAWDYGRYVALARWGYQAGFLTETEAWELIMPAARKLQKTYDSWEDFGKTYLIGREFWSVEQTKLNGQLYSNGYKKLLTEPRSPWNRHPWNTELGQGNILDD
jgi:hypothetical protein